MAVDEDGGARKKTRLHTAANSRISTNQDKTVTRLAMADRIGAQPAQESASEFVNFLHLTTGDDWGRRGRFWFHQENILKICLGSGRYTGAAVDVVNFEKVHDGKPLDFEDTIHSGQAEAAPAVQEIGNMRLLEAGFLGQAQPGQIALVNMIQQVSAKLFL